MLFRFRDKVNFAEPLGRQLYEAVRRSSSHCTAHRNGLLESFLYDSPDGLSAIENAFAVIQQRTRTFSPQHDELNWALGQAGSLLIARQACDLHYMASGDEYEFEGLPADPSRIKLFLANFQGVSSRRPRPRLTLVPSA